MTTSRFRRVRLDLSQGCKFTSKLFGDPFEKFLDCGAVAYECGGHLETTRRDVTYSGLHVVGDPFNEVAAVLVLHVEHLLVHL